MFSCVRNPYNYPMSPLVEDGCSSCETILQELENIDDDTDRHGIHFVKTKDLKFAKELGVSQFPSLVYFEDKNPSIYEGKKRLVFCLVFVVI